MKYQKKVLVIQTAFLGDAVLSIPLLKNIRREFKDCTIAFVCRAGFGELFLKSGLADQVFEVNKKDRDSLKSVFVNMKKFAPDIIFSPHRSFRTLSWVFRLGAIETVGFKSIIGRFIFDKMILYNSAQHDVLRQLSLLQVYGSNKVPTYEPDLSLKIDVENNPRFENLRDFVALSPGSQWNTKRWNLEGYVAVGKRIQNMGKGIVILGAAGESDLCLNLEKSLPGSVNLFGKTTVYELAQLLRQVQVLICNDSGTMHVATAVDTPVVSIFGPTVPEQGYAPWSKKSRIVQTDLPCRPCGAHGHDACPIKTHACMKNVTVDMVFSACQDFFE